MKKYKLEIILFIVNAIYMILELIASRVLSPYFGSNQILFVLSIVMFLLNFLLYEKSIKKIYCKLVIGIIQVFKNVYIVPCNLKKLK